MVNKKEIPPSDWLFHKTNRIDSKFNIDIMKYSRSKGTKKSLNSHRYKLNNPLLKQFFLITKHRDYNIVYVPLGLEHPWMS